MNEINFQCTYRGKVSKNLYRVIGCAYDPVSDNRIILFVPIDKTENFGPFYLDEADFLDAFEYVGC